ncbi:MAG: hypothetical protein H6817_02735 [Phycisphaerales bacterium]|nr:hypothetical protein [Phycisphaerales bacterium]
MQRGKRYLKMYLTVLVVLFSANAAMAQFPGPFQFSFATSLLNKIFLLPFTFLGCL